MEKEAGLSSGGSSLVFRGCHLPPGFRFQPTDQEIIVYYLKKKIAATATSVTSIIADVDIYKFDPWDLPDKAMFGEGEWFFFSPRDRKYPNGARPNRTAGSGYWKATGTDKPILAAGGAHCLGVKKALVFYQGRSPKGTKTEWVMHEYRLLDTDAAAVTAHNRRPTDSMRLDDWVLCRVRKKGVSLGPDMDDMMTSSDPATTTDISMAAAHREAHHHHHHQVPDAGRTGGFGDIDDWNKDDGHLLQYLLAAGSPHHHHGLIDHHQYPSSGCAGGAAAAGGHGMVPVPGAAGGGAPSNTLVSVLESIKRNLSFQAIDELYLMHQPSSKRANCMTTMLSRGGADDDQHMSSSPTSFSISETDEVF